MNAGDERVSSYMSPFVRSVHPGDRLDYVRECLDGWRVSCLAVIEDDDGDVIHLRGVVSRTDLLYAGRVMWDEKGAARFELPSVPVRSIMTEDVVCVQRDDSLRHAASLMVEHHIHRVFVESLGSIVGVLAARDVMRAISDSGVAGVLADYMSSPVTALHADASVGTAIHVLDSERISGLVVLDGGWPCGVFTQEEALHARHLATGMALSRAMNPAILVLPESTSLHRAAANAASVDVRRVIVSRDNLMIGIMSSLDFCRALL